MNPNQILQRGGGMVRDVAGLAERIGRSVASVPYGIVRDARQGRPAKPDMDDATLAHKVETEIFRGTRAPKPAVNVNVVDGVVWLRGEVKRPQQIRSLEAKARSVPEVRGVENLLHLTKTAAPTRADTPKRQQRTRSSTRRPTPRRTQGRISDDRTDALVPDGEATPAEHARTGQGRSPAPLGSKGGAEGGESQGAARNQGPAESQGSAGSQESGGSQESAETPPTGQAAGTPPTGQAAETPSAPQAPEAPSAPQAADTPPTPQAAEAPPTRQSPE